MDPVILELAKMGVSIFLQASRAANLTEEQAQALFDQEKIKFDARNPDDLNEV